MSDEQQGYVWGYRRVSSVQQSYARQTEDLTAALLKRGVPADDIEDHIFEDKMSGKTMDRPGLTALLRRARRGDIVCVSSLDRLGRTVLGVLQTFEDLEKKGIRVRSLKEGEEFEGITGTLLRNIMLSVAQWEREMIKERAAEGRAARAANGERKPRAKTALTPEKVAAAKTLRAEGKTIAWITSSLGVSRASVYRALESA
ncbi:recombinase family protein [Microbacterium sp. EYE_5]|uniref:recombinase family protein n=1 Tax=unclassified Microbacterium TaxID=2609290 RepID=UPI002005C53B|nr:MULTISPECIES: recombinase family protein [unclassified Microbacterium]MCK6080097.1 recombinase family protein [Microbacterium sp. EYE_382]MCK6085368.1 recombinase family protein [Microbacterium sp. EYE_384]MCK6122407.1 recombinase family protein [Microbacterium sp. EYE_80]MCK6126131.1 recombinase family protein [Microbacterium sp. EYE_79]MCK6141052.1 recombinase family protein [Microbacterium sp. EYE_39]